VVEGLTGAQAVVDVSNSPSFEDAAVLQFFETSTGTLLAAERKVGIKHHVVLSIIGADRELASGYLRAKVAQERLVADGGVPYTIIRATQFFEFLAAIADSNTTDGIVRLPSGHLQPIAASDLAVAVADTDWSQGRRFGPERTCNQPGNWGVRDAGGDLVGPLPYPLADPQRTN
jgi:uncharacterized protein YbjT (DUF2867 family)